MTLDLEGYDISIDLARSGINKVLASLERLPLWQRIYEGTQETTNPRGISVRTTYKLEVSRPRIRPADEQPDQLATASPADGPQEGPSVSVGVWLDVAGEGHTQVSVQGSTVLSHSADLRGEMSVVVQALLKKVGGAERLFLTFRDAKVQKLILTAMPSDLKPVFSRTVEWIAEHELRRRQQDLPLTGLIALNGAIQGNVETLLLKSHFYRMVDGDLALGLAASAAPGAAPGTARIPWALVRQGYDDLTVSVSTAYLNRLVGNAIANTKGQVWRFSPRADRRGKNEFELRSLVLAPEDGGRIRFTARLGQTRTSVSADGVVALSARQDRLQVLMSELDLDLPGGRGVLTKLLANVLYVVAEQIGLRIAQRRVEPLLDQVEERGSGVLIDQRLFDGLPEGLSVGTRVSDVRSGPAGLLLTFRLESTP